MHIIACCAEAYHIPIYRDVINAKRSDGFTPLHLVASRNDGPGDISIGLIPLSEEIQYRIIRLLLGHGADKSICAEEHYTPYDLVNIHHQISRALLRIQGRKDEHEFYCSQTETSVDNQSSAGISRNQKYLAALTFR